MRINRRYEIFNSEIRSLIKSAEADDRLCDHPPIAGIGRNANGSRCLQARPISWRRLGLDSCDLRFGKRNGLTLAAASGAGVAVRSAAKSCAARFASAGKFRAGDQLIFGQHFGQHKVINSLIIRSNHNLTVFGGLKSSRIVVT